MPTSKIHGVNFQILTVFENNLPRYVIHTNTPNNFRSLLIIVKHQSSFCTQVAHITLCFRISERNLSRIISCMILKQNNEIKKESTIVSSLVYLLVSPHYFHSIYVYLISAESHAHSWLTKQPPRAIAEI